jgi:hypothetical protein
MYICIVSLLSGQVFAHSSAWQDTPDTVELWTSISSGDHRRLEFMLGHDSSLALRRSADGRGGAWWGCEHGNVRALALLTAAAQASQAVAESFDVFTFDMDAAQKKPHELCVAPKCDVAKLKKAVQTELPSAKQRLVEVKKLMEVAEEEQEVESFELNDMLDHDDIDEEL